MDLIQRSIDLHGAAAVYRASCRALEGDYGPLLHEVELAAHDLSVAWTAMTQAYSQMPHAADHREAAQE